MYDVDGKLLSGIKSIYANSLACVKVKGGESECFRIESGVRAEQVMSLLLFNVYMNVSEISRGGERLIALSLVCR